MKFAIMSDLHVGSKKCYEDKIIKFTNIAWSEGCKDILVSGDLVDGLGCYRGQEYDQDITGYGNQGDRLLKILPQYAGVRYHFIDGNHDNKCKYRVGIEFHRYLEGRALSLDRSDLVALGDSFGNVELGKTRVHLWHPTGSANKNLAQDYLESINESPDILVIGHFHIARHEVVNNTNVIFAGCFQGKTSYMRHLALRPAIGGWIVEVNGKDVLPRFVTL